MHWLSSGSVVGGHNALEFLDESRGWTMFDPTFGGYYETVDGKRSVAAVGLGGLPATWRQAGAVPGGIERSGNFADGAPFNRRVTLVGYVEPWLYTRVGPRISPRPFNAAFIMTGPRAGRFAFSYWALRGSIVATALVLAASTLIVVRQRRHQRRSRHQEVGPEALTDDAVAVRAG